MLNARKAEAIVIIFLIAVVIAISIGKGALKKDNNNSKSNEWNVSFKTDSLKITEGSVENQETKVDSDKLSFVSTFNKVGEFYEASINVENKGSIDAYLKSISLEGLSLEQQKYLTYSTSFGSNTFNDSVLGLDIKLPSKSEEVFKIRVEYKNPNYSNEEKVSATVVLEFVSK